MLSSVAGVLISCACILITVNNCVFARQYGPDPWDYEKDEQTSLQDPQLPSDLRINKDGKCDSKHDTGQWFFKRILNIVIKGGQVKKHDDGSVDVVMHMKFSKDPYALVDELLRSNDAFTEDDYRKALGYFEEAILKPTLAEEIIFMWNDYIYIYLEQYKLYLMWLFGTAAAIMFAKNMWRQISLKHLFICAFILLYSYEAFVSYKEAEQIEYEKLISSLNKCNWYFWTSNCVLPTPDPLVFLKHLHPLKIGMRLLSIFVSEPILALSTVIKGMVYGLTDGMSFPFNMIANIILILSFITIFVMLFMLVILNFVLNIPFNFSIFAGLVNIGMRQRRRNILDSDLDREPIRNQQDRISGPNLDKLINILADRVETRPIQNKLQFKSSQNKSCLIKSASTGRLCDMVDGTNTVMDAKNRNLYRDFAQGSGDSQKSIQFKNLHCD